MTAGSRAACACAFCTATGTSISCRLRGPKFWEEARGVGPTTRPWGVRWASGEICVEKKRKSPKHPSFFLFFFPQTPSEFNYSFWIFIFYQPRQMWIQPFNLRTNLSLPITSTSLRNIPHNRGYIVLST